LENYPLAVSDDKLFEWLEHSNISVFNKILIKLHKEEFIDYHEGQCVLLPKGIQLAEDTVIKNS
jgi:hypothetical protein